MYHFSADRMWESAKEAYAIGKSLGDEVVIMSTSTGGTLALQLAATYPEIKGLINFSPNLAINDPSAFLLNKPWGLQISRQVFGGNTRTVPSDENYRKYWYDTYRLEAVVELQELVSSVARASTYREVTCPVWSGFYYRDKEHQDPTVKVSAIEDMHSKLGTPDSLHRAVAFPNAQTHVIACDLMSKSLDEVMASIELFAVEVLHLRKQTEVPELIPLP
jgi:esterase/lipase